MHWFAAQADHAAETAASLADYQSVLLGRSMSPPRSPSSVGRHPALQPATPSSVLALVV
jgi:hypothetical protein